ncbi:MAG: Mur ligase family protein, partial [Fervidobacterium sp.]
LYFTRPYNTMKIGLFRIEQLLSQMGNPHSTIQYFHVTGSNGKGSVTTFLEYLTYMHGHNVTGFYSPHLSTILERFHYNTEMITEDDFVEVAKIVRKYAETMDKISDEFSPSFFEYMTAMYFYLTKMKGAEYGSVEVGLGGRFDSTNVIIPQVSVISTISLEHTNVLGNTAEEIAFEKAGIIKPGKPVVIGEMPNGAKQVIRNIATQKGSKVYEFGRDFDAEIVECNLNRNVYNYHGEHNIEGISVQLNGQHQLYNLAVALKAFELVHPLDEQKVKLAFSKAFIPGRFEFLNGFILDGSHNPQAAQNFAENIELYFPNQRRAALFGILDDKDKESVLKILGPEFDTMIITRPPSKRASRIKETYEIARKYCKNVILEVDSIVGLERLREIDIENKFITGSFYLIGYLRDYLVNGRISEELNIGGA